MTAGTFPASEVTRIASRYQLGAEVANGALCTVYRGHDLALRRTVAIKVIAGEHIAAYRRALEASAAFAHPAAICAVDAIEDGGYLFLMQEHIASARPLGDYLTRGTPVERALDLVAQVAAAVAYAHSFGVAHGDLTPAAVLVDQLAKVHINNFGMPADDAYFTRSTAEIQADGSMAGIELATLSPGEAHDTQALGMLLWSLLAGSREGELSRSLRPETPDEVRALMRAALSGTVGAGDLVRDLRTVADELARLRSHEPEVAPPMVLAARADAAKAPAWSRQPTSASHHQVPAQPLEWERPSTTNEEPQPTPVLSSIDAGPGQRPSGLQGAAEGDEAADEITLLLHPAEPTPSEAEAGLSPTVVVLLCIILFVLFFLVGFYSIVLSH